MKEKLTDREAGKKGGREGGREERRGGEGTPHKMNDGERRQE